MVIARAKVPLLLITFRSLSATLCDSYWGLSSSVATAIADVFRKNAISMGRKFAKMLKIFDKINGIKSQRVI